GVPPRRPARRARRAPPRDVRGAEAVADADGADRRAGRGLASRAEPEDARPPRAPTVGDRARARPTAVCPSGRRARPLPGPRARPARRTVDERRLRRPPLVRRRGRPGG